MVRRDWKLQELWKPARLRPFACFALPVLTTKKVLKYPSFGDELVMSFQPFGQPANALRHFPERRFRAAF
jgi:hypothetical protein